LRSLSKGTSLTLREIGRAFTGRVVRESSPTAGGGIIARVEPKPQIVVASPQAEPFALGGYRLVVILDAEQYFFLAAISVAQNVAQKWFSAMYALGTEGRAYLVGKVPVEFGEAFRDFESYFLLARELKLSTLAKFPPAHRLLKLVGPSDRIGEAAAEFKGRPEFTLLGPTYLDASANDGLAIKYLQQLIVSAPIEFGAELAAAVRDFRFRINRQSTLKLSGRFRGSGSAQLTFEFDPKRL
jgi:primosomal protein N' (replication factor Y)